MNNLLCKRTRHKELSIGEAFEMSDEIRSMPIQLHLSTALREKTFELALETTCSIYDCLYLALAEALDAHLVTADKKLFQAIQNGPFSQRMLWVEDVDAAKG